MANLQHLSFSGVIQILVAIWYWPLRLSVCRCTPMNKMVGFMCLHDMKNPMKFIVPTPPHEKSAYDNPFTSNFQNLTVQFARSAVFGAVQYLTAINHFE